MLRTFTWDGLLEIGRSMGCRRTGYCRSERRLDGKTAIVTGGNSGIGLATAADLWNRGAKVVITSRDLTKGEAALDELRKTSGRNDNHGKLQVAILDLASLESVRRSAAQLLASLDRIDMLVNNAGVMMPPFGLTEDGFELQFGTNYLGHFLFTLLLLPRIQESAPARIVIVSSLAHRFYENLDLETMNNPKKYYPLHAYGRSKSANIMFARELAKRLEGTDVNVYSLNPGYVGTKLYRYGDESMFTGFLYMTEKILYRTIFKDPWIGAQTSIHCAVCKAVENESGLYYEECRPVKLTKTCLDDKLCRELWERSLVWVNLGPDYNIFGSNSLIPTTLQKVQTNKQEATYT